MDSSATTALTVDSFDGALDSSRWTRRRNWYGYASRLAYGVPIPAYMGTIPTCHRDKCHEQIRIYYNRVDQGRHYAAWEQPLLFSEEVRAGFRPLRK